MEPIRTQESSKRNAGDSLLMETLQTKLLNPSLGKGQSDHHCWKWGKARATAENGRELGKLSSRSRKGKLSGRFLFVLAQMPVKGRGGVTSAMTQERIVQARLQYLCYES